MEKKIITTEYTMYGGDHYRTLYLDKGVGGNTQLCLTNGGGTALAIHLTSTDPDYSDWLFKHHASLLIIDEKHWFKPTDRSNNYWSEFRYTLSKFQKLNIDYL